MKIKVSEYIAEFLAAHEVKHVFTVTGGGAMHLNDAFGHHRKLTCIYNHHEQASAMAAESYARLTGKIAAVCVTSGPGGTNAITGVLGGWQDSIPMFVISGQVKRETTTWSTTVPLRQLGDQEFQITDTVKTMTKYAYMVTEPEEIRYHLEKAWFLCQSGRKGPVWLDIPVDVQGAFIDSEDLQAFDVTEFNRCENPVYDSSLTPIIFQKIKEAKHPVILAGTGIRLGDAYQEFIKSIEMLHIPVLTEWNAHDLLWDEHPLFCGRPGTLGTRGGNFIIQNCDLLLVLGSRLNIRMIGYNYKEFAQRAFKIVVDIDKNELCKPTVFADMPVHADVKALLQSFLASEAEGKVEVSNSDHTKWLAWCRKINAQYPAVLPMYCKQNKPLNPYVFVQRLFHGLEENDKIVCGNGSACVITFQAAEIKPKQRLFTNSGCAAMGYGFPAAIGTCIASKGERIICIDGDGSFQMNIQELQTVQYHRLNLKIFILNNNGYHSIRQTQTNLFHAPLVGVCDGNGISFPHLEKIACAYEIPYLMIDSLTGIEAKINQAISSSGPILCEVVVDTQQNFEPKLASKAMPDGTMVSASLDDMFPFLPKEEYEAVRLESQL